MTANPRITALAVASVRSRIDVARQLVLFARAQCHAACRAVDASNDGDEVLKTSIRRWAHLQNRAAAYRARLASELTTLAKMSL